MKKHLLFIFITLLTYSLVNAQSQFENASFEEWEPEDENSPFFEPVEWSSIKTGDHTAAGASPVVMYRSDDAHSGNYSVYLINKYTGIIDHVATGTITNGRIHIDDGLDPAKSNSFTDINDSQWNTPLTKKPDSVVGWYKANPVPGDFPTFKVILHADSNSIPGDSLKWIARAYWKGDDGVAVNEWTRFSVPFDYYLDDTPEFLLSILTAGNGLYAVDESEAWFDDLELIYNGTDITETQAELFTTYYNNGEVIIIPTDQGIKNANIKIVDINGRQIYSGQVDNLHDYKVRLDLPEGIYIVNLSSMDKNYSKKIIVQ